MSSKIAILILAGVLLNGCVVQQNAQQATTPEGSPSQAGSAEAPEKTPPSIHPWAGIAGEATAKSGATVNLLTRNWYVVLDGSGSMAQKDCANGSNKEAVAHKALKSFAESLPPEDNLGLLAFDNAGISERVPLGSANRPAFDKAVDESVANNSTPLRTAITKAYEYMRQQGIAQLGYGEYHLVVVTDGAADFGEDPSSIVDKVLAESPVVIQTIGFCIGTDHSLNQPGRTLYYSADNPEELKKSFEKVLAEADDFAVGVTENSASK